MQRMTSVAKGRIYALRAVDAAPKTRCWQGSVAPLHEGLI